MAKLLQRRAGEPNRAVLARLALKGCAMKSASWRIRTSMTILLVLSSSTALASEGMLLCHVTGVDRNINNSYIVNAKFPAVKKYVEANGLAYNLIDLANNQIGTDIDPDVFSIDPEFFTRKLAERFHSVYNLTQAGLPERIRGNLAGAFFYDYDLVEHSDGTVTGMYLRIITPIFPGQFSCRVIELDGEG
ncbi:hypothetical protein [Pannonibacter phragmitetus]|nr:hypothetical protein [Pannonibacter phragmitetus]